MFDERMNGGPKIIHREGKGGGIAKAGEGDIEAVTDGGQDLEKRTSFHPKMQGWALEGGGTGKDPPTEERVTS